MPPECPGAVDETAGDAGAVGSRADGGAPRPLDDETTTRPVDEVLAELADAEAAEARALAEAEEATRRAGELRAAAAQAPRSRAALRSRIGVGLAGLVAGGCAVLTGLMLWQHAGAAAQRSHDAQIVEGARAGVSALLTIDHTRARADVQRVLDLSTGTFREDFAKTADDFVATAESQKVVTVARIKATALESVDDDGGVVLVAVNSEVTNAAGAKQDARPFRMSVTVARDGGQFKMSSLEFVP